MNDEFNKTSSLYKDAVSKVSGVINDLILEQQG
jgi:hypothetical protein